MSHLEDFEIKDGVLIKYHGYDENIVIPNSVTKIGDNAFYCYRNLKSIEMPSVIIIGINAFYGCISLTSIKMPNVTIIGNSAFNFCGNLKSIEMPNVTIIEDSVFSECINLESIEMSNVTTIGNYVFDDCISLTSIEIPHSVKTIGSFTFSFCENLQIVYISRDTKLGENVFYECYHNLKIVYYEDIISKKLPINNFEIQNNVLVRYNGKNEEKVIIPKEVTSIDSRAFMGNLDIQSVVIHEGVKSIGERAFFGCENLINVHMCEDTSIGDNAFKYCHLDLIVFKETHTNNFIIEDGVIKRYLGNAENITIPMVVTSIDSCAFMGCMSLKSVTMFENIKSIGERAFFGCENLIRVNKFEGTIIGDNAFKYCHHDLEIEYIIS